MLLDHAPSPALEKGEGTLVFRVHGAKTSIESIASHSPLKLLAPKNHGTFAWVFAANFGGGLVDGDHLHVRARVCEGASALLGTQSATKVYRSPDDGKGCRQTLDCAVERDASLVLLPDPVCCFESARYEQRNDVRLAQGASLVLLDGLTCGRSARGERWAFSRYFSRTRVFHEGRLVALDATLLDPAHGDLTDRMSRFDAIATLIVLGPRFRELAQAARSEPPKLSTRADVIVSPSALQGGGAILRIAGVSVEKVTLAVRAALQTLPDALGDDPFARKW